jgi:hypothetical protein
MIKNQFVLPVINLMNFTMWYSSSITFDGKKRHFHTSVSLIQQMDKCVCPVVTFHFMCIQQIQFNKHKTL